MTNEEAIEKLGYIKQQYNLLLGTDIYDEVIDTAIKALKDNVRPQSDFEITNEDIQQAIKEGFANGYEMAKEKIIHSIAEQYSAHNELVPIWLSIGDIKAVQNDEI